MAVGNYRLSSETYRGIHVGSGRGTVGSPRAIDPSGMFGKAFQTTIKAGLDWYQSVVDVGRAMQGKGKRDEAEAADAAKRAGAELRKVGEDGAEGFANESV